MTAGGDRGRAPVCPKCSGAMVEGFVPDVMDGGYRGWSRWVEGVPEKGWLGAKIPKDAAQFRLSAYRCAKCGYVETYARDALE